MHKEGQKLGKGWVVTSYPQAIQKEAPPPHYWVNKAVLFPPAHYLVSRPISGGHDACGR